MSSVYEYDIKYPGMYDVFDDYDDTVANDRLCPECNQHVIRVYKDKKQISEADSPEAYR